MFPTGKATKKQSTNIDAIKMKTLKDKNEASSKPETSTPNPIGGKSSTGVSPFKLLQATGKPLPVSGPQPHRPAPLFNLDPKLRDEFKKFPEIAIVLDLVLKLDNELDALKMKNPALLSDKEKERMAELENELPDAYVQLNYMTHLGGAHPRDVSLQTYLAGATSIATGSAFGFATSALSSTLAEAHTTSAWVPPVVYAASLAITNPLGRKLREFINRRMGGVEYEVAFNLPHHSPFGPSLQAAGNLAVSMLSVPTYSILNGALYSAFQSERLKHTDPSQLAPGQHVVPSLAEEVLRPYLVTIMQGLIVSGVLTSAVKLTYKRAGVKNAYELPMKAGAKEAVSGVYAKNPLPWKDTKTVTLLTREMSKSFGGALAGGVGLAGARAGIFPDAHTGVEVGVRALGGLTSFFAVDWATQLVATHFYDHPTRHPVKRNVELNAVRVEQNRKARAANYREALDYSISGRDQRVLGGVAEEGDRVYELAQAALRPNSYVGERAPKEVRALVKELGLIDRNIKTIIQNEAVSGNDSRASRTLVADAEQLSKTVSDLVKTLRSVRRNKELGLLSGHIKGVNDRICDLGSVLLQTLIHLGPTSLDMPAADVDVASPAEPAPLPALMQLVHQIQPLLDAQRKIERGSSAEEFLKVLDSYRGVSFKGPLELSTSNLAKPEAVVLKLGQAMTARDVASYINRRQTHAVKTDQMIAINKLAKDKSSNINPEKRIRLAILHGLLSMSPELEEDDATGIRRARQNLASLKKLSPQDAREQLINILSSGKRFSVDHLLRAIEQLDAEERAGQDVEKQDGFKSEIIKTIENKLPGLLDVLHDEAGTALAAGGIKVEKYAARKLEALFPDERILQARAEDLQNLPNSVKLRQMAGMMIVPLTDTEFEEFAKRSDVHFHTTGYAGSQNSLKVMIRYMDTTGTMRSVAMAVPHEVEHRTPEAQYYAVLNGTLQRHDHDWSTAEQWLALNENDRKRIIPCATGVRPKDASALANDLNRLFASFPGVFKGIGETTWFKEIVSKQTGEGGARESINAVATSGQLDYAADSGRFILVHGDASLPLAKDLLRGQFFNIIREVVERRSRMHWRGNVEGFSQIYEGRPDEEPKAVLKVIYAHLGGISRTTNPSINFIDDTIEQLKDNLLRQVLHFDLSWLPTTQFCWRSTEDMFINGAKREENPDVKEFASKMGAAFQKLRKGYDTYKKDVDEADKNNDMGDKIQAGDYRRIAKGESDKWLEETRKFVKAFPRAFQDEDVRDYMVRILKGETKDKNNILHLLFEYGANCIFGTDSLHLQSIHSGDIDNVMASQNYIAIEGILKAVADCEDFPDDIRAKCRAADENFRHGTFDRVVDDVGLAARREAYDGYLKDYIKTSLTGPANPGDLSDNDSDFSEDTLDWETASETSKTSTASLSKYEDASEVKRVQLASQSGGDITFNSTARGAVVRALKQDVKTPGVFLNEKDGDSICRKRNIGVRVFRDDVPKDFERVIMGGGGDCELFTLGTIHNLLTTEKYVIPSATQRQEMRNDASDGIGGEDAENVMISMLNGHDEPGIGSSMQGLLDSWRKGEPVEEVELLPSPVAPHEASVEHGDGAYATMGRDSDLVSNLAALHVGGNHFDMLVRKGTKEYDILKNSKGVVFA